jgi:phosphonate transport system permease protein
MRAGPVLFDGGQDMSDMAAGRLDQVQANYMAMTRRKRAYGSVMLIVFIALMVSGFRLADGRNAGGFWDGIGNIFQFPGEVLQEGARRSPTCRG